MITRAWPRLVPLLGLWAVPAGLSGLSIAVRDSSARVADAILLVATAGFLVSLLAMAVVLLRELVKLDEEDAALADLDESSKRIARWGRPTIVAFALAAAASTAAAGVGYLVGRAAIRVFDTAAVPSVRGGDEPEASRRAKLPITTEPRSSSTPTPSPSEGVAKPTPSPRDGIDPWKLLLSNDVHTRTAAARLSLDYSRGLLDQMGDAWQMSCDESGCSGKTSTGCLVAIEGELVLVDCESWQDVVHVSGSLLWVDRLRGVGNLTLADDEGLGVATFDLRAPPRSR